MTSTGDSRAADSVTIVIVNWNSGDLLGRCLRSLAADGACRAPLDVVVVDNASTDDSLEACRGAPSLRLVRNDRNEGFGRACNIGARLAAGRCLLFLNPDCEVHPGSIDRCLDALRDPTVGVCGVGLVDEQGDVARSCHRFPSWKTFAARILGLHLLSTRWGDGAMLDWDHAADADVDHVIGAFYAIDRQLFEQLDGFDERFFVYLEDLDLSLRVKRSGRRVRFLARPHSFHLGGGVSRQIKARRLFYATRSRILYAYKHFAGWQAGLHLFLTLAIEPISRAGQSLLNGRFGGVRETARAFTWLWGDLPQTLRRARTR